jgi:hypothetical protein
MERRGLLTGIRCAHVYKYTVHVCTLLRPCHWTYADCVGRKRRGLHRLHRRGYVDRHPRCELLERNAQPSKRGCDLRLSLPWLEKR